MSKDSQGPESIIVFREAIEAPSQTPVAPRTAVRVVIVAALVLVAAVMVAAHIAVSSDADEYAGLLAIADRGFDLLLAAALTFAAFSVGSSISRALAVTYRGAAEEFSFCVFMGTGAIGLATLGLGLCKVLSPGPVFGLIGLLLLVTARSGVARAAVLAGRLSRLVASYRPGLVVCAFGLMVGMFALRTLLPPTAFDELIYHLPVPKSFVDQGRVFPVYDNPMGNFPFLIHMIYAICLMAKSDTAARLFSLILASVTAIVLYGFCVRFLNRKTGVVALFGFFGAGMVVEVATSARVDVSLAGMLFAATYAVMVYLEEGQTGWLYFSAILGGLAMGIKYDAGVWLVLIGVFYLFEEIFRRGAPVARVMKRGLLYIAVCAAVASPWYVKNLVWFHNPIYWFGTGELRDVPPQPMRYFSEDDERKMDTYLDETRREIPLTTRTVRQELDAWALHRFERHPLRVWDHFLHPGTFNVGEPYQDPNYLFMIAPLLLLISRPRKLLWLGFCCAGFFIIVAGVTWVGRYLLPVYPGMTVIAAFVLVEIAGKLHSHAPVARFLPIIAVGAAVCSALVVSGANLHSRNGLGLLQGAISRRDFMRQFGFYSPIEAINSRLPRDARIMMLGAELGYGIRRNYLADPCWDATEWRRLLVHNNSLEEINQDIKRRGITHVLFYPHQFRMVAGLGREGSGLNGMNRPAAATELQPQSDSTPELTGRPDYWNQFRTWATFELYSAKYLEEIYTDKYQFHLYRVK